MKTLLYFKNKYELSLTHTGRDSAKINAEKNLKPDDYQKFLEWVDLIDRYESVNKSERIEILKDAETFLKPIEYECFLKWTLKNPQKPRR
jgi:hypothetical protein